MLLKWVNAYNEFGALGSQRKRQNTVYDSNFKLNTVNLYLTSECSYREAANQLGKSRIDWVKKYRQAGPRFCLSEHEKTGENHEKQG